MLSSTNVTIRMDAQLKKQAEALFADMGMNMTTAFNIFTRTAIKQGRIPFDITGDPFNNPVNHAHLLAAAERMRKTGGTVHDLIEPDEDIND